MPKKIIIISIFFAALIGWLSFSIKAEFAKQAYRQQITTQVQQLLAQQQWLLQRFSKRLVEPSLAESIVQNDFKNLIIALRSYEDLAYSLAKQGLGIPVSIQFVALTARPLVISSAGKVDTSVLAPDQNYYLHVVDNPEQMQISRSYVTPEMPGYLMRNLGLGVLDGDNFVAQLDVKFALSSLQYFVTQQLGANELFNFSFDTPDLQQPQISLNTYAYVRTGLNFMVLWLFSVTALIMGGLLVLQVFKKYRKQQQELQLANMNYAHEFAENTARKHAMAVQYKYGVLAANAGQTEQHEQTQQAIDLQELLQDIQYVNAEWALERGVLFDFPLSPYHNLRFYGSQLQLMQILSGIVYEIVKQLPANSTITLQVLIENLPNNEPQLTFKFSDNGFYAELQDSQAVISLADVRAKGWGNIQELLRAEYAELQHTHTAYSGNTICFTIKRRIMNNVVRLAEFM